MKKTLTKKEQAKVDDELFEAIRFGSNMNRIVILLNQVFEIDIQDELGRTPLHWATLCDNIALVELLLTRGAKVDIQANDGRTALHNAIICGHKEIVNLLLKYGADPNIENDNKETAFHCLLDIKIRDAVEVEPADELEIAKILIHNKVNLNKLDAKGKPPLFYAVLYNENRIEIIKLIVKNGAKIGKQQFEELNLNNHNIDSNIIDILKLVLITDKSFEEHTVPAIGNGQINLEAAD